MESRDLTCFCRVYEEKGINKAARQLYISKQGLSRIIQNLEEELQVQLFRRSKQGIEPTIYADFLYEKAQSLIIQIEQLKRDLALLKESEGEIRIGFATGALRALDFIELQKLQEQNPNIKHQFFEDSNKNIQARLLSQDLDIGFLIGLMPGGQFVSTKVAESQLEVLVNKNHQWFERSSISFLELKDQPLVTLNESYHSYYFLMQRASDLGFIPNIVFQVMEPGMLEKLVLAGIGIGIDVNLHKDCDPALVRIPLEDSFGWSVFCTCSEKKSRDETVANLYRLICKEEQEKMNRSFTH